ncbi:SAV_2336 N-terminal domain-related protein [Streptomyces actuosus]|uniref:SAV_2336 N-terminal domain-related protein n=1 Tax=Streptomyces actuosus TaxID=1885 RepID=UPI001F062225|nr:SAV_2336 N-terminal domain-related protein [Streptomyces actuosus]
MASETSGTGDPRPSPPAGPNAGPAGVGRRAEPDLPAAQPPGGRAPLDRLSALLTAAANTVPTPRELAEVLWLAARSGQEAESGAAEPEPGAGRRDAGTDPPTGPAASVGPACIGEPDRGPSPARPASAPAGEDRVPLHLPAPADGPRSDGGGRSLLAPAPPMLHHPLALQRALRPLGRRVPSPRVRVLDERATADRIALLGARPEVWLPVLRPASDRWLRLNVVHDAGPTMPVWRPLVRELHALLAQSGLFRTVALRPAGPDGHAPHVPDPGDGRTVTLVVSDQMGPQWRPGPAGERWYGTLRRWAARMPLAVVQPLPERLWAATALPAAAGVLTAPAAAAPSAALAFTPHDPDAAPAADGALPLPVLEPGAPWLAHWAALVASPDAGRVPGAAAWLPPTPPRPADPASDPAASSPEDLVLRFRATASPQAFRLAGHLALAVPSVPVMRLVQRAVEREPRPQHLAEVILSGMLTAVPGPAGTYAFRPGVRDLLLRSLPRTARGRTREFLAEVGGLIDERAGVTAGEFRARPASHGGPERSDGAAFATVSEETVRRLGGDEPGALLDGRYRLVALRGPGRRMWDAVDVVGDRRVVVHRYPEHERAEDTELFLRQARELAQVESPHVVRVLDFGVEERAPHLVTEFVDGVTLSELCPGRRAELSLPAFARLAEQGQSGLGALHARGLVRGQPGWAGLLLRPDGTVLICRFALGEESRGRDVDADEEDFRRLLEELAPRTGLPAEDRWNLVGLVRRYDLTEAARLAARLGSAPDRVPARTYTLLGPPRVSDGARYLDPPSPEALALLCMLVQASGRRVGRAELAEGLWDAPPPREEAVERIEGLLAEVRRVVAPGALVALRDGWALHAPDDHIDVRVLQESISDSRRLRQAWDLFYGDPLDGVPGPAAATARTRLRTIRAQLDIEFRPSQARPTIAVHAEDGLDGRPEARITLESAVHDMLARGGLTPDRYEVRVLADGYVVRTDPDTYLLPVLAAVLRGLPQAVAGLPRAPRLRALLWDRSAEPPELPDLWQRSTASHLVAVSPALYEEFAASSAARGPHRFRPLHDGGPGSPSLAWFCPVAVGEPEQETGERGPVQGPFITQDLRRLGIPTAGRTAIVHTRPDGSLTLLDPADPYGGRPPRARTYYEVDLTPHRTRHEVSLPSSGKGVFGAAVELSWHVDDAPAFVHAESGPPEQRLLDHLLEEASRITRRHPLRRAGAAQRAVNAGVGGWPVPGLSVSYSVQLAREGTPPPVPQRTDGPPASPTALLAGSGTVLIGFDGPLVRLYSARTAREAALDLLRLSQTRLGEDDGRPEGGSFPRPLREAPAHPLDVLRAFARHPLGPMLRRHLDVIELRAAPDAPTTHHAVALVRALHEAGRRVCVVSDVGEQAIHKSLAPFDLPFAGVHGRSDDLDRLLPRPDCLRRALGSSPGPDATGVLIGSTVEGLRAARELGLGFIGLARTPAAERELSEAGCEQVVSSLTPLLEAARNR